MKKNLMGLGLKGIFSIAMLFAADLSANEWPTETPELYDRLVRSCIATVRRDCEIWAREGGGSEAPRGLQANTKAELAMGERYILTGRIDISGSDVYLQINFNDHPWLANKTRKKNPYYRIDDAAGYWRKYQGKILTIVVVAKWNTFPVGNGRRQLEIVLLPSDNAIIDALQRR